MSILFYKRPDYIPRPDRPLNLSDCQKYVDRANCCKATIPPELSFENVIENKAMPVGDLDTYSSRELISNSHARYTISWTT